MRGWYPRWGKRLMDIFLASGGLIVFTIPMVWIGWRIWRQSGRSPFFRQTRIGLNGAPFVILKFRTMSETGQVTPFGHWLRTTAMDELPQLSHILRGQMSFIGPRPLIPEELSELPQIPHGTRRLSIRPGLTGLAQVNSSKVPSLSERIRWDCAYLDRCSARLDLKILLKSVGVTLRGAWDHSGRHVAPVER